MSNLDFGSLDYSDLKFAPAKERVPLLADGDLLFNRTNSAELLGKSAVFRDRGEPVSFASYLIRVRVVGTEPGFVASWINSAFGRSWIARNRSQQVGQANLSGGKLVAMPIPLPPPAEAAEILRRLDDALAALDETAAAVDAQLRNVAALRQSVLKAAFEGRLVPQEPADEPAASLLARLTPQQPARKRGRARRA